MWQLAATKDQYVPHLIQTRYNQPPYIWFIPQPNGKLRSNLTRDNGTSNISGTDTPERTPQHTLQTSRHTTETINPGQHIHQIFFHNDGRIGTQADGATATLTGNMMQIGIIYPYKTYTNVGTGILCT